MNLEIRLPWPKPALSPNARLHWSQASKAKKAYRHSCWGEAALVLCAAAADHARIIQWTDQGRTLMVDLEFTPPDRRSYDEDNLIARMKSGLDGVADALGVNDKLFWLQSVKVTGAQKGGCVVVRIWTEGGS